MVGTGAPNGIREIVLNDVYKPHTFEEIGELVSPEVAERLGPQKRYDVWWFNSGRRTRTQVAERGPDGGSYRQRQKVRLKPHDEWIAVPVPDASVPRELVEAAREAIKDDHR